ncbi:hypothetical protein F5876DRAFT_70608 [Lentinula aff. lateritia]|uniref:Uncharacterized protein n=1 Tax=Lentinula aff. lateritia TaxID=2804960 RepID=A0ACC1TIB0_9AGAR|nr:hypothetical protein F5876DRAFT_70608 [Lentinula aff. lateritia]
MSAFPFPTILIDHLYKFTSVSIVPAILTRTEDLKKLAISLWTDEFEIDKVAHPVPSLSLYLLFVIYVPPSPKRTRGVTTRKSRVEVEIKFVLEVTETKAKRSPPLDPLHLGSQLPYLLYASRQTRKLYWNGNGIISMQYICQICKIDLLKANEDEQSLCDMLTTCACNLNIYLSTPTQWGRRSDEGNRESQVDAVGGIDEEAKGPEWEIVQEDRDVDVDLDIASPPRHQYQDLPRWPWNFQYHHLLELSSKALTLPSQSRPGFADRSHQGFPTWEREKGSTGEMEND